MRVVSNTHTCQAIYVGKITHHCNNAFYENLKLKVLKLLENVTIYRLIINNNNSKSIYLIIKKEKKTNEHL